MTIGQLKSSLASLSEDELLAVAEELSSACAGFDRSVPAAWLVEALSVFATGDFVKDRAQSDHADFLAFMTGELARFPCCCEEGEHASTPPYCWPELIACIVRRAKRDALSSQGEAASVS